jgi:hypothetical protein
VLTLIFICIKMPYDDHVRGLLSMRSARAVPLAFSPAQTADTFSMRSPQPHQSPSFTEWSESPSCYSRSRMSLDDTCSEVSDDRGATSGYYDNRPVRESDLGMAWVLTKHHGSEPRDDNSMSEANTGYRDSYVDPLRDSSEDERSEVKSTVQSSCSDDTLSDHGMLRPVESDTSVSSAVSGNAALDPRLSFLG